MTAEPGRRRLAWSIRSTWVFAILLSVCTASARGSDSPPPSEYDVKAAFLYNFSRFADWPGVQTASEQSEILHICVLGVDPFKDAFAAIVGRAAAGRTLVVKRHRSLSELTDCEILFVSDSEVDRVDQIMRHFRSRPVLTVSDISEFARRGGIINFVVRNKKIRFQINLDAVERSGIKLSSKLLRLAEVIREEGLAK